MLFRILLLFLLAQAAFAQDGPRAAALEPLGALVEGQIKAGKIPGAVVLVGNREGTLYRRAFGNRALEPEAQPMAEDTVFDLASLTKVVATTTAIMQLVEQDRLHLEDPVARYWPEFGANGKEGITVRDLLTHYSGLRADLDLKPKWSGRATALRLIEAERPVRAQGTAYLYSDINFEALGELVRRVSGLPLDAYCERHIFGPLGLKDTGFNPPPAAWPRIAPTEYRDGKMLRGQVHDPTASRMGGVAGHAGLFSTADDLAIFARMLLNGGISGGARILDPAAVERMTAPHSPAGASRLRGLGWDLAGPFAANWGYQTIEKADQQVPSPLAGEGQGEGAEPYQIENSMLRASKRRITLSPALPHQGGGGLSTASYGHTGFTGTSLWIDPVAGVFIIVLTSRLHPDGKGEVSPLRAEVAAALGAALGNPSAFPAPRVATGIDVLAAENFASLAGKRVGLVTNHSGVDAAGRRTIDLLRNARGVRLAALFSPEHGLQGNLDEKIASGAEPDTGLPVHSLYGEVRRPTDEMLEGLDALVFDIQDAGARFYTYITTMAYAMEAAARRGIDFYVLDRPNPIGGDAVQGPVLDRGLESFAGYFPLPVRHGMTAGELARLFNAENRIGAKLHVIPMSGWRRGDWHDQTGLPWVAPSPNLRSLAQAALYPGVALVEGTNVSVGRGTDSPFELVGAPWVDGEELAAHLNARNIKGVRFAPADFVPGQSRYQGRTCHGVRVELTDRAALDSPALGIELASALYRLYPRDFRPDQTLGSIGSREVLAAIKGGQDPRAIAASWQDRLEEFRRLREKYLLY